MSKIFYFNLKFCVVVWWIICKSIIAEVSSFDSLTPYVRNHGSRLNHRAIRECHEKELGFAPYEIYPSQKSWNLSSSFVEVKRFIEGSQSLVGTKLIRGHYAVVSNPLKTFSVLEPKQVRGCALNARQTVTETAKKRNCIVAINAGYFNTRNGNCLGNVVSDGRKAHDSGGVQNAHFGIKTDGSIFTGYVSEEELQRESGNFLQLVGGVVWLVRNGSDYVNTSKFLECEDTEETGTMDKFLDITSARTAVGHDSSGRVVIVQVDGKSSVDGISLWDFQDLLRKFDVVNAINLDGGGSATFVVNGTVVNYPTDDCSGSTFSCEREVSTVLCIHPPDCEPMNCNGHGQCIMGKCECNTNWLPPLCDQLMCGNSNCSGHGLCLDDGCLCELGYFGNYCDRVCPNGWYGFKCQNQCYCQNDATCDPVNGVCKCPPGFTGPKCNNVCPHDHYGQNCEKTCFCENSCFCDPVDGTCDIQSNTSALYIVATCLAEKLSQQKLSNNTEEQSKWRVVVVILIVITALCMASSLLLIFYSCTCYCTSKRSLCSKRKPKYRNLGALVSDITLSDSSDSDTLPMRVVEKRCNLRL